MRNSFFTAIKRCGLGCFWFDLFATHYQHSRRDYAHCWRFTLIDSRDNVAFSLSLPLPLITCLISQLRRWRNSKWVLVKTEFFPNTRVWLCQYQMRRWLNGWGHFPIQILQHTPSSHVLRNINVTCVKNGPWKASNWGYLNMEEIPTTDLERSLYR